MDAHNPKPEIPDAEAAGSIEGAVLAHLAPAAAPAQPAPDGTLQRPVVSGLAVGGVAAAVAGLDRVLAEHGETLRALSSGPFSSALLQNWWAFLLAYVIGRAASARWRQWLAASAARDAAAAAADAAQLRALRHVARESERVAAQIEALRGEVAGVRTIAQLTDERQRRESEDLRRHVDNVAGDLDRRLRRVEPAREG